MNPRCKACGARMAERSQSTPTAWWDFSITFYVCDGCRRTVVPAQDFIRGVKVSHGTFEL